MSVFSDCLNIDFIDIVKSIFKQLKGKFTYDKKGLNNIFEVVLTDPEIIENEIYTKYVNEMKDTFVSQI